MMGGVRFGFVDLPLDSFFENLNVGLGDVVVVNSPGPVLFGDKIGINGNWVGLH
jgi:hypothetical protein